MWLWVITLAIHDTQCGCGKFKKGWLFTKVWKRRGYHYGKERVFTNYSLAMGEKGYHTELGEMD
jgi:hypothetical protein